MPSDPSPEARPQIPNLPVLGLYSRSAREISLYNALEQNVELGRLIRLILLF